LLNDDRVALLVKKTREGKLVEEKDSAESALAAPESSAFETKPGASSALSIMAVSGLLESVLCSNRDTTSPERCDSRLSHP